MKMRGAAATAAVVLVLAGCSTSQPTAMQLAHKIAGCRQFVTMPPSPLAIASVDCSVQYGGGSSINVVTFENVASERKWIQQQGIYYGCCVEGNDWAAMYNTGAIIDGFPWIIRSLGGHQVQNDS